MSLTEVLLLLMIGSLDEMLFMCCHLGFVADFHQGMCSRDQCTCWNDVCVLVCDWMTVGNTAYIDGVLQWPAVISSLIGQSGC